MPKTAINTLNTRNSMSSTLHSILRNAIISLEMEPGEAISRHLIASQYNISQMPVREAILKLEEEGLVQTFPQSRTVVAKIDINHAQQTQFLRLSLELEIIKRLTLDSSITLLEQAEFHLKQQKESLKSNDLSNFSSHDKAFHRSLYEAIHMENLWDLISSRSGHIDRLRNLNLPVKGKSTSILKCHRTILDSIYEGDLITAENITREHLSGTLSQIENIQTRYPNFF